MVAVAKGSLGVNLNDTIRSPNPQNKGIGKHSEQLFFTETELYHFEVPIDCNANF